MSASDNVLLSFDGLPPFSQITPQQVKPAVEQAIAQARAAVERVVASPDVSWHSLVEQLEQDGVSAEVVDLRSLVPLDREHVIASVRKTGRLIVVDEDYHSFGVSGEIIASVVEHDLGMLKASPQRVAFPDIPIPFTPVMEQWALPNAEKIVAAYQQMHEEQNR